MILRRNKTLEAYFRRFKFIPNENDRKRLLSSIDEFMTAESTFSNVVAGDNSEVPSGVSNLLESLSSTMVGIKFMPEVKDLPN